jgi:hypothetical protein
MWRRGADLLVGALLAALLTGCTGAGARPDEDQQGCGPVTTEQVEGRRPAYVSGSLARFENDHALCRGLWLPGMGAGFVPQGLAVDGPVAWVNGYDGTKRLGNRPCIVQKVSLRDGRLLARASPVEGAVPGRRPTFCRHGGGILVDGAGVWLVETSRLWLLDPEDLSVRRVWSLAAPVRGSFALWGPAGRLGIGTYATGGGGRVDWFPTGAVLADGAVVLAAGPGAAEQAGEGPAGVVTAARSQRAPSHAQGAVHGRVGGRTGVWFARSNTRCGVLAGPADVDLAFVPGAEGMDLEGDALWVLSESPARSYQRRGRPLVPMLSRFDAPAIARGAEAGCTP